MYKFLDLGATDEEEEEEDNNNNNNNANDLSNSKQSVDCFMAPGSSGKDSFNRAVDNMMMQSSWPSQPQGTQTQRSLPILEGVPIPLLKKIFIVDLFSGVFFNM